MKKIILVALMCVCLFNSLHAQFSVQLEAGGILSTFRRGAGNANIFLANTSASPKLDYHVAVIGNISTSKRFGAYAGLSFDNRGAHFSQPKYDDRDDRDISIQYLAIPAGIRYELCRIKKMAIHATAGMYAALAIAGREKGISYSANYNRTAAIFTAIKIRSKNDSQILPTSVMPFDCGTQASVQATAGRYSLIIQYSHGIGGVLTNPSLYDRQYYNSSFGLFFGYRL